MKIKLTEEMKKQIEKVKSKALEISENLPLLMIHKIEMKASKNKTFVFHIINSGKPMLRVYINEKFYKMFSFSNGIWKEIQV